MPTFSAKGNDEYICQLCTLILDSVDHPPAWRPDLTGHEYAGNVCPQCVSVYEMVRDGSHKQPEQTMTAIAPAPVTTGKKIWDRDEINRLLEMSDIAVERAMVALYKRQTHDEQQAEETKHSNGVGFAGNAAHNGTYFAKWVLSGKHLTGEFLVKARKIALRHSRQLMDEANK